MTDDDIRDVFSGFGPVTVRRMFGGKGIYRDGVIFALYLHDQLRLKADAESSPELAAAGSTQWTYQGRHGKDVAMPYWSAPESALDDPDEMADLARKAYAAALRAEQKKK
ncbi:MAG: TfoX/Sxy family protein [Mesorhizobium sp.]|nr:TfoX/Sxy family protein [Mesorhizobium sp.]